MHIPTRKTTLQRTGSVEKQAGVREERQEECNDGEQVGEGKSSVHKADLPSSECSWPNS